MWEMRALETRNRDLRVSRHAMVMACLRRDTSCVPFGRYGEMRMTAMDLVGLLLLLFLVVPLVTARPSRY